MVLGKSCHPCREKVFAKKQSVTESIKLISSVDGTQDSAYTTRLLSIITIWALVSTNDWLINTLSKKAMETGLIHVTRVCVD